MTAPLRRHTDVTKFVKFNRDNKDFDMYLDGRYIGSRATHHEAEVELDRVAYELLGGN